MVVNAGWSHRRHLRHMSKDVPENASHPSPLEILVGSWVAGPAARGLTVAGQIRFVMDDTCAAIPR
jgi:hypothetical protein